MSLKILAVLFIKRVLVQKISAARHNVDLILMFFFHENFIPCVCFFGLLSLSSVFDMSWYVHLHSCRPDPLRGGCSLFQACQSEKHAGGWHCSFKMDATYWEMEQILMLSDRVREILILLFFLFYFSTETSSLLWQTPNTLWTCTHVHFIFFFLSKGQDLICNNGPVNKKLSSTPPRSPVSGFSVGLIHLMVDLHCLFSFACASA